MEIKTVINKNVVSYEVISDTSEDKKEEKKTTKKKEEKK